LLACPAGLPGVRCAGSLELAGRDYLKCSMCGTSFAVEGGIPILLPPFTTSSLTTEWERQRAYYDDLVDVEFEIGRPEAGGRFYNYVLDTKFRRALGSPALSASFDRVLDACCGSGVLSGELARRTRGSVVGFDFSLG